MRINLKNPHELKRLSYKLFTYFCFCLLVTEQFLHLNVFLKLEKAIQNFASRELGEFQQKQFQNMCGVQKDNSLFRLILFLKELIVKTNYLKNSWFL